MLICTMHYVKLVLNGVFIMKYYYNIKDYMAYHPVGHLNTFLMITFYYGMLFVNIKQLTDNHVCVYVIGVYPLTDWLIVAYSTMKMRRVIAMKSKIENDPRFKVFKKTYDQKLREVLYLPVSYESDIEEDHDE